MRKVIFLGLFVCFNTLLTFAQTDFEVFVSYFPERQIIDPIFNINANGTSDFLNASEIPLDLYNKIIVKDKPSFHLLNGTIESVDFLGTVSKEGIEYVNHDDDGNEISTNMFYTKVYPLARINLKSSFVTLLVSIRGIDGTSIYLLNFHENGELLSAINLIALGASVEEPASFGNLLLDFSFEPDGKIFQKYDGLDFYRERRFGLRDDGYFQVVWQNVIDR